MTWPQYLWWVITDLNTRLGFTVGIFVGAAALAGLFKLKEILERPNANV